MKAAALVWSTLLWFGEKHDITADEIPYRATCGLAVKGLARGWNAIKHITAEPSVRSNDSRLYVKRHAGRSNVTLANDTKQIRH